MKGHFSYTGLLKKIMADAGVNFIQKSVKNSEDSCI